MNWASLIFSLSEILFPVLLLTPSIMAALEIPIEYKQIEFVLNGVWIYLLMLLIAALYYVNESGDGMFIFFLISIAVIVVVSYRQLIRWVLIKVITTTTT